MAAEERGTSHQPQTTLRSMSSIDHCSCGEMPPAPIRPFRFDAAASFDDETLASLAAQLIDVCARTETSIAFAESCTGGLIGHIVTEVPGSSGAFLGSVVSYANSAKIGLLGVPSALIEEHGAVSAPVAEAMARGVRARMGADLAVAVTGIAGPGGGSDEKPVGTTYVAISDADGTVVERFVWAGDRRENKRQTAATALLALIERIACL